jgi:His/Glu/Gln/Arg/opine family amino acid ABC transporter permease subunit
VTFDWAVVWSSLPLLLQGAVTTVVLTVLTMALAIPGGLLLAALRMAPLAPLRLAATAFVEFFRATPLILQLYWAFYRRSSTSASRSGPPRWSAWSATSPRSTPRRSAPASLRFGRASGTPASRSA